MVNGSWEGKGLKNPEFRKLFEPESIIGSKWYQQRLGNPNQMSTKVIGGRVKYLEEFLKDHINREASERLGIQERLDFAQDALSRLEDKSRSCFKDSWMSGY